jgi:hypothetical protein
MKTRLIFYLIVVGLFPLLSFAQTTSPIFQTMSNYSILDRPASFRDMQSKLINKEYDKIDFEDEIRNLKLILENKYLVILDSISLETIEINNTTKIRLNIGTTHKEDFSTPFVNSTDIILDSLKKDILEQLAKEIDNFLKKGNIDNTLLKTFNIDIQSELNDYLENTIDSIIKSTSIPVNIDEAIVYINSELKLNLIKAKEYFILKLGEAEYELIEVANRTERFMVNLGVGIGYTETKGFSEPSIMMVWEPKNWAISALFNIHSVEYTRIDSNQTIDNLQDYENGENPYEIVEQRIKGLYGLHVSWAANEYLEVEAIGAFFSEKHVFQQFEIGAGFTVPFFYDMRLTFNSCYYSALNHSNYFKDIFSDELMYGACISKKEEFSPVLMIGHRRINHMDINDYQKWIFEYSIPFNLGGF